MSTSVISKSVVRKVANLARLSSSSADGYIEDDLATTQLQAILDRAEVLSAVDTTILSQTSKGTTQLNKTIKICDLREDIPPSNPEEYARIRQNILNNAPKLKNDYFVIPRLLD